MRNPGWIMITLKGKNQIAKFRQVAEELAAQVSQLGGVAGIIFIGGLAREFADKYSDLDITVLIRKESSELKRQVRRLADERSKSSGIDIDLEVHSLASWKKRKWDEVDRWDYSKAEVTFDPKGELKELVTAKLKTHEDLWLRRIVTCAEYMKWYACPPAEDAATIAETWIDRGDLMSAHYSLSYAADLILEALYALNREFLPPQKWRIHSSYSLKWLPSDYEKLLREALTVRNLSARELERRMRTIRKLWSEILNKIEHETGFTAQQLSKHYVKTVLNQNF